MTSCPVFIDGEWREGNGSTTSPVYNPSRGEVIAEVPMCGRDIVDEAVESAAAAFPAWRETPLKRGDAVEIVRARQGG